MAKQTYRKPIRKSVNGDPFGELEKRAEPEKPIDSGHITEEASLDTYLDIAENEQQLPSLERDAEIEELKEKLQRAKLERDEFRMKVKELTELSEKDSGIPAPVPENNGLKERIKLLEEENSELKKTVSMLGAENARLSRVAEDAQRAADRMLHTYTKPGYMNGSGVRKLRNGYQDWV
jgi:chromosome segregation ATPase